MRRAQQAGSVQQAEAAAPGEWGEQRAPKSGAVPWAARRAGRRAPRSLAERLARPVMWELQALPVVPAGTAERWVALSSGTVRRTPAAPPEGSATLGPPELARQALEQVRSKAERARTALLPVSPPAASVPVVEPERAAKLVARA